MLYLGYQTQSDLLLPARLMAGVFSSMMRLAPEQWTNSLPMRQLLAGCEMLERAKLTHTRPPFGIDKVTLLNGKEVGITEEATLTTAFGTLLRFKKDKAMEQPRVLVVAPLSGHFATLLRNTVMTLLPEHDVYITDWHNARDIPLSEGRFGFDEYIDHVIRFLETIGPGGHLLAVCQPCAHAFAAVALMAENKNLATPRSMTLMAGPIDCRINPTKVNQLATEHSIDWFERNLISNVPFPNKGAGRRVYPGFLQLTAFMSMNAKRHIDTHVELFENLVSGDSEKAAATKTFYDEYFAVLDLTAEFYLETVQKVFQDYQLPKGELTWRGQKVNPKAIERTALLTVEGERDDICAVGQTLAAQDLCSKLRPYLKKHHLQPGVGHYGVFSGRKWQTQTYPIVRNLILSRD